MSVIRRLPRYYRFLQELKNSGVTRISSRDLAERMGSSASQIRQDFNCFGGFGQQGYGYDVDFLYDVIGKILGLQECHPAMLIGIGNLGRAVIHHMSLPSLGFSLVALFDIDPDVVGTEVGGLVVRDVATLEDFCRDSDVETVFLCLPRESAAQMADVLYKGGIRYFWNFSHYDFATRYPDVIVENVHLNDSLMTLCYRINEDKHPSPSLSADKGE